MVPLDIIIFVLRRREYILQRKLFHKKANMFILNSKYEIMGRPLQFHWRGLIDPEETTKQKRRMKTTKSN